MSEDYLKMFTGVVLLIFVIIAGYFFSERNDRKMVSVKPMPSVTPAPCRLN
ncbi:conjugal transfer protein TrbA [Escherichia coli]|nr:conjugal transfer protein TrbA [Escherichia coli]